jgi:hypothetical protein
MKNSIFWDITQRSLVKVDQHFSGTYRFHLQRGLPPALCWFLAWLTLQPWRWRQYVPLTCQLTFTGLHSIISQKIRSLHNHCCENLKSDINIDVSRQKINFMVHVYKWKTSMIPKIQNSICLCWWKQEKSFGKGTVTLFVMSLVEYCFLNLLQYSSELTACEVSRIPGYIHDTKLYKHQPINDRTFLLSFISGKNLWCLLSLKCSICIMRPINC